MSKKPSPAQLKLLGQLVDGSRVRTWRGISAESWSYIVPSGQDPLRLRGDSVHGGTLWAAYKAGWLRIVREGWRELVYEITDAGRAALTAEKGET